MRAWDEVDPGARSRAADSSERAAHGAPAEEAASADPAGHDHPHPHQRSGPDERPFLGIVGAGRVGTALGVALARAGWPVHAVASRDPARRARFVELVGGPVRPFADAAALLDEVELILLCVPDDAIEVLAGELRLYAGQALVHTSGALGAEALAPAMAAGTQAGAFHPLVAFADLDRSVAALDGATIVVEGDDQLVDLLARMAEAIGAVPVRLRPGTKAAYHAAAVLSAGGLVAMLDAIAELGRVAGLDENESLAIYGRLMDQTMANARALGIRDALTGPATRGDVGTLVRHLEALARHAPDVLPLYRAAAAREIDLALERGSIDAAVAERFRSALASNR
ncbi:MAG TPA: DUF2520 domain-containing protein [Candidatus Limnocylindrales bacterium]|nr:DUF2520 domain-containing protein [Candidatus Limnocylindrales bacterium]